VVRDRHRLQVDLGDGPGGWNDERAPAFRIDCEARLHRAGAVVLGLLVDDRALQHAVGGRDADHAGGIDDGQPGRCERFPRPEHEDQLVRRRRRRHEIRRKWAAAEDAAGGRVHDHGLRHASGAQHGDQAVGTKPRERAHADPRARERHVAEQAHRACVHEADPVGIRARPVTARDRQGGPVGRERPAAEEVPQRHLPPRQRAKRQRLEPGERSPVRLPGGDGHAEHRGDGRLRCPHRLRGGSAAREEQHPRTRARERGQRPAKDASSSFTTDYARPVPGGPG
jgi:hypothetical protein